MMKSILLTTDYNQWKADDKMTLKNFGYLYSDLIKKEQHFIKELLRNKYKDTRADPKLLIITRIEANIGHRKTSDYKVVLEHSPAYYNFMRTGWWSREGKFDDFRDFFILRRYGTGNEM